MVASQWKDIFEAAANGDVEAVRNFVEVNGVPVQSVNEEKQTLAHIAAENTHLNVLKYVLGKDPSLLKHKDIYDNTVLYHAVERGFLPMVKYLVDELDANIYDIVSPLTGNNAIHVAAEEGRLDVLKYFVEDEKAEVNTRNDFGEPPLFVAAAKLQLSAVKYLIEVGNATVEAADLTQNTILSVSAKVGDVTVPRYLLDTRKVNLDVNHGNELGRTAAYLASRYNRLAFLKYIVEEKHADVNKCDDIGRTPIHSAALNGHLRIVKYLIKHGAKPEVKDRYGRSVRDGCNNSEVIEYLDSVMHAPRNRRSVSWQYESATNSLPEAGGLILEDSTPLRLPVNGQGFALPESMNVVHKQYLLFAAIFMGYAVQTGHRPAVLQPAEIIQNRMDPLALDAVKEHPVKFSE